MKKLVIDGKEYTIRTLPLQYAPEVFEIVQEMFRAADLVVEESAEPVPKDRDERLKVFLAIVEYTQEEITKAQGKRKK